MKVLILYDRESRDCNGADFYSQIRENPALSGHDTDSVLLSCDEINPCTGCFGCWVKTPGACVITKDSANEAAAKFIQADVVIILSRITYGGFSADVKSFLDRNISSILPFFKTIGGEMHHEKRYGKYPCWVAIGFGDYTDNERDTFTGLVKRNVINLHAPKHLTLTAHDKDGLLAPLDQIPDFLEEVSA